MRLRTLVAIIVVAATAAVAQDDAAVYITAGDTAYFTPASALSTTAMPGKWFQRRAAFAARGDYLLLAQAGVQCPDLSIAPDLHGRHNLYVNLREIDRLSGLQLKLSGEALAHTITPAMGTEQVHTNREILWATDVDLTGRTILMRSIGRLVYFSYLKFVPVEADRPDVAVDPERVAREPLYDPGDEWSRTQDTVPDGMSELRRLPKQPATPARDDGRGYVLCARTYLDLVFPEDIPAAGEVVSELRVAAARGEYEPVVFSVHAFRDLGPCRISVGDLSSDEDTIDGSEIGISPVALRNLRTTFRGNVYMRAPALLQTRSEVSIAAGRTQQFWLTVHVPPQTPAGRYTGSITITPQNAPTSSLELVLRVYPFELPEPSDISLGMYDQLWSARTDGAWLRDRFADMRAHGMTTVGYCGGLNGVVDLEDGVARVRFDGTSRFEQVMEAYREAGFPRPLLWLMQGDMWAWCGEQQGMPGSPELEELYRQVIMSILEQSRRRRWPGIIFQPVDEPGSYGVRTDAARIERWAVQSRLIKEAGGIVEVDHIPFSTDDPRLKDALEQALPSIDIFTQRFSTRPIWFEPDGWWWGNMKEQAAEWGKQLWSYNINNANFFPELPTLRLAYGVFVWREGVGGQLTWSYQQPAGNPLNCLDGTHTDMMYTWPEMPGAGIRGGPSPMWECIREGVDDLRYLLALERLIEQAEAQGEHERASAARAVLADLRDSLDMEELRERNTYIECRWEEAQTNSAGAGAVGGSFNIPNGWELDDYDRWRRRVARQIVASGRGR